MRAIFLTGSPICSSLRWDEAELLDGPVRPFSTQEKEETAQHQRPLPRRARWRLLQTVIAKDNNEDALFLTTRDLMEPVSGGTLEEEQKKEKDEVGSGLSRFYDHSFAVYGSFDKSGETESWPESGIEEGDTLPLSPVKQQQPAAAAIPRSVKRSVSDIAVIPNANYLRSIVPQTMTVNLVVAIIAVHPPRRVMTRQWKKELDLTELVVGDDTRTGFGVTFWLSPGEEDKNLSTLRPRDIVLLQTVALSSFGERVYGQSLRRGTTRIDLLHRRSVDWKEDGGLYNVGAIDDAMNRMDPLLAKVHRVREWTVRFLGYPTTGRGTKRRHDELLLPPDTQ